MPMILAATMLVSMPASAATQVTITPRQQGDPLAVPACTGTNGGLVDRFCVNNNDFLGRDFGTVDEVTVLHTPGGGVSNPAIRFQADYFGSYRPGFYRAGTGDPSTITFTPMTGIEIALVSFDVRRGTATSLGTQNFTLTDGEGELLWSLDTTLGSSSGMFTTFEVDSAFVSGPLVFGYRSATGAQVISNVVFAWRTADDGGNGGAGPSPSP